MKTFKELLMAPLWGALFVMMLPLLGFFVLIDVVIIDRIKEWRNK